MSVATKSTKTEQARQLSSIRASARCVSLETGEILAFVLDEQFNFIPISERLHNCLASVEVRSLDELRRHVEKHGVRSFWYVKNLGKACLREIEEVLAHRRAGAKPEREAGQKERVNPCQKSYLELAS